MKIELITEQVDSSFVNELSVADSNANLNAILVMFMHHQSSPQARQYYSLNIFH